MRPVDPDTQWYFSLKNSELPNIMRTPGLAQLSVSRGMFLGSGEPLIDDLLLQCEGFDTAAST